MLSCTSIAVALWSPAGKGLTSWLSFVMSNCNIVTFPLVSWVSVSIPDLCPLFAMKVDIGKVCPVIADW